jgi:hypothetical protein
VVGVVDRGIILSSVGLVHLVRVLHAAGVLSVQQKASNDCRTAHYFTFHHNLVPVLRLDHADQVRPIHPLPDGIFAHPGIKPNYS